MAGLSRQDEILTRYRRDEVREVKRAPTEKIQRQIMEECGDSACLLYAFYVSKSYLDRYQYVDQDAARHLGWSVSKVERARRELMRHYWFHKAKGQMFDGRRVAVTYLGKNKVLAAKGLRMLEDEEMAALEERVREAFNLSPDDRLTASAKKVYWELQEEAMKRNKPGAIAKFDAEKEEPLFSDFESDSTEEIA